MLRLGNNLALHLYRVCPGVKPQDLFYSQVSLGETKKCGSEQVVEIRPFASEGDGLGVGPRVAADASEGPAAG